MRALVEDCRMLEVTGLDVAWSELLSSTQIVCLADSSLYLAHVLAALRLVYPRYLQAR